jgi:hypothetical protein
MSKLPQNYLLKTPTGRWAFVGSVDMRLGYTNKDGSLITDPADAANRYRSISTPAMLFKSRSFETKEAAINAAKSLGLDWKDHD